MLGEFGIVILAGGEGKRLKLDTPKPLAPALGQRLIDYPIIQARKFLKTKEIKGEIGVVTGHGKELVEKYLNNMYTNEDKVHFALQEKQLGTADAIRSYYSKCEFAKKKEYTLVLCADTPLIREWDLSAMYDCIIEDDFDGVAATFIENDPTGYGRIVRSEEGFHIVEEKDADEEIKEITEVNSGLYIFKTKFVLDHLDKIDSKNESGEFYLTDLFKDDYKVRPLLFEESERFMGVNTLTQLEEMNNYLQFEKNSYLRESGVRFIDSGSCYIDWNVEIGPGCTIYPNCIIEGETKIGCNVNIGLGVFIKNSVIEDNVSIKSYCHFESAVVEKSAILGPFARLRPGAMIGKESKIGNFVEIKKATLAEGVKVSHLSYVGDAHVGKNTNIGCGFITCNYDGAKKHLTEIGENCYIGADSQTVAPVKIGDSCYVACGSTINKDMKDDSFAISRNKQDTKEGLAKRFLKNKK